MRSGRRQTFTLCVGVLHWNGVRKLVFKRMKIKSSPAGSPLHAFPLKFDNIELFVVGVITLHASENYEP